MKILFVSEKPEDFETFLTDREKLFDDGHEIACSSSNLGVSASLIVNKVLVVNAATYDPDVVVYGHLAGDVPKTWLSLREWKEVLKSGRAESTRGKRNLRR